MPLFSVVIPCYNRADSILPTLSSVREQTLDDWECLIIDDGSNDGKSLLRRVENLGDSRFRVIRRENGGGGAARNTGVIEAQGDFIAFLDSDDLFLPEKLARFAEVVEPNETLAWYAPTYVDRGVRKRWVRPSRAIGPHEDMGEYLFVDNEFIQTSTIVVPTLVARKTAFDPTLRKGQDLDFCLRLHAAGVRFKMLPDPLTVWMDASEVGRTSHRPGYEAQMAWLENTKGIMTPAASHGYRATVLAYYLSGTRPFTAMKYILSGWLFGGVPSKVVIRQILRSFMPRRLYRELANAYVAIFGRS